MLVEIERFVNLSCRTRQGWVRRRNPDARTWRDYSYDLKQFADVVGDRPPGDITFHDVAFRPLDLSRYRAGLPDWLVEQLERYQHLRQPNWRPARLERQIRSF